MPGARSAPGKDRRGLATPVDPPDLERDDPRPEYAIGRPIGQRFRPGIDQRGSKGTPSVGAGRD